MDVLCLAGHVSHYKKEQNYKWVVTKNEILQQGWWYMCLTIEPVTTQHLVHTTHAIWRASQEGLAWPWPADWTSAWQMRNICSANKGQVVQKCVCMYVRVCVLEWARDQPTITHTVNLTTCDLTLTLQNECCVSRPKRSSFWNKSEKHLNTYFLRIYSHLL